MTEPMKRIALILVCLLTITQCKEASMQTYTAEQITAIDVTSVDASSVEITYAPILETAYYSPGAVVSESDDGLLIAFVRCPIKGECETTHDAAIGEGQSYKVVIEHNGKPIVMGPEGSKKQLFPKT